MSGMEDLMTLILRKQLDDKTELHENTPVDLGRGQNRNLCKQSSGS